MAKPRPRDAAGAPPFVARRPTHRVHRGPRPGFNRQRAPRGHRNAGRRRGNTRRTADHGGERPFHLRRRPRRGLPDRSRPVRLRDPRRAGLGRGRRGDDARSHPRAQPGHGGHHRRRRGTAQLRHQHRGGADGCPAIAHHQRAGGGGQPPRRLHSGGGRLRHRRLVHQHLDARLSGQSRRSADRHHDRRHAERHLGLLERLQGQPFRGPGEHGRGHRFPGDRGHRLPVHRSARRDPRFHHRRTGARPEVHRGPGSRIRRRPAVLPAYGHGAPVRPGNPRVGFRRASGEPGLDSGFRTERAESPGGQGPSRGRARGSFVVLLLRRHRQCQLSALDLGCRVPQRSPLGPPDRHLDRHAVDQPVVPPRLVHSAQEHLRLPEGRLRCHRRPLDHRRRLLPPAVGPRRLATPVPGGRKPRTAEARSPNWRPDSPPAAAPRSARSSSWTPMEFR